MLKFPERYYGGPFVRVPDPDRDLPKRRDGEPIDPKVIARVEFDGLFEGERFVAPFHDGNTLYDILGIIELVSYYPDCWDDDELYRYPTLQGSLAEAEDRLRDRIGRLKNPDRARVFEAALRGITEARVLISDRQHDAASRVLADVALQLQEGNKAHHRRGPAIPLPPGGPHQPPEGDA